VRSEAAQADTHTTPAINPTRMTRFHLVNTVFQIGHIPVSSDVPDSLAGRWVPQACKGGGPAGPVSQGSPGSRVRVWSTVVLALWCVVARQRRRVELVGITMITLGPMPFDGTATPGGKSPFTGGDT
jgi:hypothetical protein